MRNANCRYSEAEETWQESLTWVGKLEDEGHVVNKATLYSEVCSLLFAKSLYDEVRGITLLFHLLDTAILEIIMSLDVSDGNTVSF